MLSRKCSRLVAACAVAATPFVSSAVTAAGLDGSSNVVCAVTYVVACLENGTCLQGQAKTFDLPELVVLDAKNKVLRATRESGHKAVSPVLSKGCGRKWCCSMHRGLAPYTGLVS